MKKFSELFEDILTEAPEDTLPSPEEEDPTAVDPTAAPVDPATAPVDPTADPNAAPVDPTAAPADAGAVDPTVAPDAAPPVDETPPTDAPKEASPMKFPKKLEMITSLIKDEWGYANCDLKKKDAKNFLLVRGKITEPEIADLGKLAERLKLKIKVENSSVGKTEMTKISIENNISLDDFLDMYGMQGPGMAPGTELGA